MFRFVPEHVSTLVETVCKSNDWVCVDIRKEGIYSGYFATISDGTNSVEKFLAYDYGLQLPVNERPALLASELASLFPPKTIGVSEPTPETAIDEKPRKRRKTE